MEVLLTDGVPVDCETVAERVGLHTNSARFHLDGLIAAGFVQKSFEKRVGKGRPRALYMATQQAPQVSEAHWSSLTRAMIIHLVNQQPDPLTKAKSAGRRWGESIAVGSRKGQEAMVGLADHLKRAGFASTVDTDDKRVMFTHCAFQTWDSAEQDPVCMMHLAMIEGYLEAADAPLEVEVLTRQPRICVAKLRQRTAGHDAPLT